MNNGTKKYNKIVKEDILKLFNDKSTVATNYITKTYNCSEYSAIRHIETLVDDGVIRRSKCGYIRAESAVS